MESCVNTSAGRESGRFRLLMSQIIADRAEKYHGSTEKQQSVERRVIVIGIAPAGKYRIE